MSKRDRVIERLLDLILDAKSRRASLEAAKESIRFAQDNGWDHTAAHLQRTAPQLATWHAVRRAEDLGVCRVAPDQSTQPVFWNEPCVRSIAAWTLPAIDGRSKGSAL